MKGDDHSLVNCVGRDSNGGSRERERWAGRWHNTTSPWRDMLGATGKACAQMQRASARVPDLPWPARRSAINGKAMASTATCAR